MKRFISVSLNLQEIFELQVSVNDMLVVCETDASDHLTENIPGFFFIQRSFSRSAPPFAEEFQEISTPHQLEG